MSNVESQGYILTHEDPEPWQCGGGLKHAVEGQHHAEEQSRDIAGSLSVRHGGDDHVCKGAGKEHEL